MEVGVRRILRPGVAHIQNEYFRHDKKTREDRWAMDIPQTEK